MQIPQLCGELYGEEALSTTSTINDTNSALSVELAGRVALHNQNEVAATTAPAQQLGFN